MATDKIRNLTHSDLGAIDDVTDDDLEQIKAACERVLPAFRGDETAAIAYIWGEGDCWERVQRAGETVNGGNLLAETLDDLTNEDKYVIDDGATGWDPDTLLGELDSEDLLAEVYCELNDTPDASGRAGYIARFDEAGYVQSSPPMYTVYLANTR